MIVLLSIHLGFYFVEVWLLILLVIFLGEYRERIFYGLLLSPLGLILPYLAGVPLVELGRLLGNNVFGSAIVVLAGLLLFLGPLLGPLLAVAFCVTRE